jgi:3-oxoadipate enol-lactonase/4-carboxymuconolactone decarboxylase
LTQNRTIRVDGPLDAPVLVLVNPPGMTAGTWDPQIGTFSAYFRVVRYEHRGHRGATVPDGPYTVDDLGADLLGVADEVGADRFSVVGLSLGAAVALWVAAKFPGRVERMVVASGLAYWPDKEVWRESTRIARRQDMSGVAGKLAERWFSAQFKAGRPEVCTGAAAMLQEVNAAGYAWCCEALSEANLLPDVPFVAAPTLVLAGADDPVVPVAAAALLAEAIPGAALQVVSPGAHLLNLEQPDRFTSAVLDHLAGTASERGRAARRAVLGDAHVERSERNVSELTAPFVDLITRYAWGDIWTRARLDRRTRSCITLAMLVALGRFDELELHLRAARRVGLSPDEIGEVLLQSAVYCGVPAANRAFAVAQRVLVET